MEGRLVDGGTKQHVPRPMTKGPIIPVHDASVSIFTLTDILCNNRL